MQEEIRRLARQAPFVSFTLHLNDGRKFRVHHPDYIFVGHGPFLVVEHTDGTSDYLQVQNISGMTVEPGPQPAGDMAAGQR